MESNFLEKDLEDIIFENKNKIHERGLPVLYEELERQRDIKGKRIDLFNYECVGEGGFAGIVITKVKLVWLGYLHYLIIHLYKQLEFTFHYDKKKYKTCICCRICLYISSY